MRSEELRNAVSVALFGNAWNAGAAQWARGIGATGGRSERTIVYVCRSGGLSLACRGSKTAVKSAAACIVSAGTPHSAAPRRHSVFARIELDFGLLGDMMPELGIPRLALARFGSGGSESTRRPITVLEGFYCDDVRVLLKRISFELAAANDKRLFTLRGMVGDLVLNLEHAIANRQRGALRIDSVLAYLNETFATASLHDAAEHFYCHPNSIANLIKRELGMTFLELVTAIRIDHACLLFEVDNLSVQEVAFACGYRNMTHFYEVFRSRCGTTPGAYRRSAVRKAS